MQDDVLSTAKRIAESVKDKNRFEAIDALDIAKVLLGNNLWFHPRNHGIEIDNFSENIFQQLNDFLGLLFSHAIKSPISQMWELMPAAIAGVTRREEWTRTKL